VLQLEEDLDVVGQSVEQLGQRLDGELPPFDPGIEVVVRGRAARRERRAVIERAELRQR
jgi:hypothetical protein